MQAVKAKTLRQYGLVPFEFKAEDQSIEIRVSLEEAFTDENYVCVASTNHAACYAIVLSKDPQYAVVQIVRNKFSSDLNGILNWIAIG